MNKALLIAILIIILLAFIFVLASADVGSDLGESTIKMITPGSGG